MPIIEPNRVSWRIVYSPAVGAGRESKEFSGMEDYKREFIEFMVESDVLKFGEFTLKTGRK